MCVCVWGGGGMWEGGGGWVTAFFFLSPAHCSFHTGSGDVVAVRVCVCVCARARACVCMCVRAF